MTRAQVVCTIPSLLIPNFISSRACIHHCNIAISTTITTTVPLPSPRRSKNMPTRVFLATKTLTHTHIRQLQCKWLMWWHWIRGANAPSHDMTTNTYNHLSCNKSQNTIDHSGSARTFFRSHCRMSTHDGSTTHWWRLCGCYWFLLSSSCSATNGKLFINHK